MYLKDEIRNRRRALGLNQTEFAKLLGISNQTISRWESGHANPASGKILKMAELFKVKPEFLASLPNKTKTNFDVLCQNLSPAAACLSEVILQSVSLGMQPVLNETPDNVITIIAQMSQIALELQRRKKEKPTCEQILESIPKDQRDTAAILYNSLTSFLVLPQYRYKVLKRCSFLDYPQKEISGRTVCLDDFLQRMPDLPKLNTEDLQLFTVVQDESFCLTQFGIKENKPFIAIRRTECITDGDLYLYSCSGLSQFAKIIVPSEDFYIFLADGVETHIPKKLVEDHECQIIGKVIDWA